MEVRDYCRKMDAELIRWKVKLYDVISKMDQVPAGSKERIYENVNGMLILMAELDDRISTLRSQCPEEWRMQDEEIRKKMVHLKNSYSTTEKVFINTVLDTVR
ncbi:MAG: hypothetical protein SCH71_13510 [Desulfobulbaceae bacterium]|nr:hypothetical protein [Desulfobulbaceae bacterium]